MRLIKYFFFVIMLTSCHPDNVCSNSKEIMQTAFLNAIEEVIYGIPSINIKANNEIDSIFLLQNELLDMAFYDKKYNIKTLEICDFEDAAEYLDFPNLPVVSYTLTDYYLPHRDNRLFVNIIPVLKTEDFFLVEIFWSRTKHVCSAYIYKFLMENGKLKLVERKLSAIC